MSVNPPLAMTLAQLGHAEQIVQTIHNTPIIAQGAAQEIVKEQLAKEQERIEKSDKGTGSRKADNRRAGDKPHQEKKKKKNFAQLKQYQEAMAEEEAVVVGYTQEATAKDAQTDEVAGSFVNFSI